MDVNQVQPKMTTGQKVATAAGVVAGAAAIGTTVYAALRGKADIAEFTTKNSDKAAEKFTDLKFADMVSYVFKKIGNGFSEIGAKIKEAFETVKSKFTAKAEEAQEVAGEASKVTDDVADEAVKSADEVADAAQDAQ